PKHVLSIHNLEEGEDGALGGGLADFSGLGVGSSSMSQAYRGRHRAGLNNRCNRWDIEHFSRTDEIRVRADHLPITVVVDLVILVAIAVEALCNSREGISRLDGVDSGRTLSHVILLLCS